MYFLGTLVAQYPTAAFFVLVLHGIAVVADILAALFTGHGVLQGEFFFAHRAVCCWLFIKIHDSLLNRFFA
jgi:hypothetical protein